jgi:hypothetical protein
VPATGFVDSVRSATTVFVRQTYARQALRSYVYVRSKTQAKSMHHHAYMPSCRHAVPDVVRLAHGSARARIVDSVRGRIAPGPPWGLGGGTGGDGVLPRGVGVGLISGFAHNAPNPHTLISNRERVISGTQEPRRVCTRRSSDRVHRTYRRLAAPPRPGTSPTRPLPQRHPPRPPTHSVPPVKLSGISLMLDIVRCAIRRELEIRDSMRSRSGREHVNMEQREPRTRDAR